MSNYFSDGKERMLHQCNPMVKSVRVYVREADTWTLRERAKAIQASSAGAWWRRWWAVALVGSWLAGGGAMTGRLPCRLPNIGRYGDAGA